MTNPAEPIVFLNGQFLPKSLAKLDVEDRGTFFGDGVYEVVRYFDGRSLAIQDHLARLRASLRAIRLGAPAWVDQLATISDELVERNRYPNATTYWQITRGSAPRDAAFPTDVVPTVLAIAYPAAPIEVQSSPAKLSAILVDDLRWHRCSIKSLMLLANVLAKNQALDAGADEAILHRDGLVTEGTTTSLGIVRQGSLWTHPADHWILDGITRRIVLQLARDAGIPVVEETFTTDELRSADEALVCGTTKLVAAVVRVDDQVIGDGHAGPVTEKLYRMIVEHIKRECGTP